MNGSTSMTILYDETGKRPSPGFPIHHNVRLFDSQLEINNL
jgi:hypothetical protein